jgi:nudix-type nucleoside diphosphatase (YffH/AdpP family)
MKRQQVLEEEIVFKSALVLEEALIESVQPPAGKTRFKRLRVNRPDASAVFIHNTESDKVVLTRQFRYAISAKVKTPILEIMAGKMDPGESPEQTAIREAMEECGYRIEEKNLFRLTSVFASPGYTSEKFHLFYATVTNADRLSGGGGLAVEHESIEVVEIPLPDFRILVKQGKIEDAKTLLSAMCAEAVYLTSF